MTMPMETKEGARNTEHSAMDVVALLLKQNNELLQEVRELRSNGTTKRGGAPRAAVRCKDTKTGKVYHSHASAGMAVAPELGLKVHNFVWYEVIAKDKTRFVDISDGEYQVVLKANAEKKETAVPPTTPPTTDKTNRPVQETKS